MMNQSLPLTESFAPEVPLAHLDDLWFQVAGTLCNLTCRHCFISCSPHNRSFGFLSLQDVRRRLEESVAMGVKEYYFTGGEPFLNPEMVSILKLTLQYGPATVLTNGTVYKNEWLDDLKRAEAASIHSLEFRVSIDGFSAATNDPIRGQGTFARAMRGIVQLVQHGFLPIVTVTSTNDDDDDAELFHSFVAMLKDHGYHRPRMKILPTLRIGAEVARRRGYLPEERVTPDMMVGFDVGQLICDHSRCVTDRGIFVCPILIDSVDARLGDSLQDAAKGFALRHQACYTCYQYGSLCSNPSAKPHEA
jgi:AdoMet-dependent heme synthase